MLFTYVDVEDIKTDQKPNFTRDVAEMVGLEQQLFYLHHFVNDSGK